MSRNLSKFKLWEKEGNDGQTVKKIKTDWNCGFWKLANVTVFQSSFSNSSIIHKKIQRKTMFNECLEIRWKTAHFTSLISPSKIIWLRNNVTHSTQRFITRGNTSKFVKNIPLRVVFSTPFSVFNLSGDETLRLVLDILLLAICGVWYNASKTVLFDTELWFCYLPVVSLLTLSSMANQDSLLAIILKI